MFNVLSAIASIAPFNAGLGNYDVPFSPDICGRVTPGPVPTNGPSSTCPYIDPNPVESINGEGHNYFRRSEEHTSELQSLMRISYAVFCLKKKQENKLHHSISNNQTTHNIKTTTSLTQ